MKSTQVFLDYLCVAFCETSEITFPFSFAYNSKEYILTKLDSISLECKRYVMKHHDVQKTIKFIILIQFAFANAFDTLQCASETNYRFHKSLYS